MNVLEYVFVDEAEAVGVELFVNAEEQTRFNTRRPDIYRYSSDKKNDSDLFRGHGEEST